MNTLALSFQSLELNGASSLESTVNVHLMTDGRSALLFDTGYDEPASLHTLIAWIRAKKVTIQGILVTHAHPDHAGGLLTLAETYCCNVYIHPLERQSIEDKGVSLRKRLAAISWRDVCAGDMIHLNAYRVETIETPGHTHGHLAWYEATTQTLIAGDNATSAGTVWIGPPDGHLAHFYESLTRLHALSAKTILPGHGESIEATPSFFVTMLKRREARSEQILNQIIRKPQSAHELAATLYGSAIAGNHMWAALATVRAHLSYLSEKNLIACHYDRAKKVLMYQASGI